MRVLLDTHVLIWALTDPGRLQADYEVIESSADEVLFSAASIWEIAIKVRLGRADFSFRPEFILSSARRSKFVERCVTAEVAATVADLPHYHRDPFDRLLVAQAVADSALLLTADPQLPPYSDLVRLIA